MEALALQVGTGAEHKEKVVRICQMVRLSCAERRKGLEQEDLDGSKKNKLTVSRVIPYTFFSLIHFPLVS